MEYLDVGFCLDYIDSYVEFSKPKDDKKETVIQASQKHFDAF